VGGKTPTYLNHPEVVSYLEVYSTGETKDAFLPRGNGELWDSPWHFVSSVTGLPALKVKWRGFITTVAMTEFALLSAFSALRT